MLARFTILLATACVLAAAQKGLGSDVVDNFNCASGPTAKAWLSVKSTLRDLFKDGGTFAVKDKKVLKDTFAKVYHELKENDALSAKAGGECSLGRLSFQLLSLTYSEPELLLELFSSFEKIASPVLSVLLDVPWLAVAQSGWPIYALLAEINLQKINSGVMNKDRVDGLDKPLGQAFYNEFMDAIIKGDGTIIGKITNMYLSVSDKDRNAYASLAAIVAGAAGSDIKQRMQLMDVMQTGLKQVISNAMELDVSLGTQWPLWGLTHVAVDVFAV